MSTDTGHHTDAADQEVVPTGHPSLEDLRTIDLLADLSDEQLQQWSDAAELYEVQTGSTISREGEESVGTILVFEGTLHGTIRNGDRDEPLSDQVGPTWVGAIQTLTGDLTSGLTLRAAGAARYAVVPPEPFTDLVVTQRPVFQQVMSRMRPVMQAMTQREQNRERLTSLGTMAAGLAHELNNPAAAAQRTAADLADALEILCKLDRSVRRVGDRARAGGRARRPADARAAVMREPDCARRAGRGRPRGRVAGCARGRRRSRAVDAGRVLRDRRARRRVRPAGRRRGRPGDAVGAALDRRLAVGTAHGARADRLDRPDEQPWSRPSSSTPTWTAARSSPSTCAKGSRTR